MKRAELEHVLFAVSKLAAWREKDQEFVRALLSHRIVTGEDIRSRLHELEPEMAERVESRLRRASR